MARKPEATSIPPDTAEIDSDWSETSSVVDSTDRAAQGPTAVPPKPYEEYARRVSTGDLSDDEARRALSAPSMPTIDAPDPGLLDLGSRDSGEMEAPFATIGQQPSGPYEIPLELGDDGQDLRGGGARFAPINQFAATPTPRVEAPDETCWRDDEPTPTGTSPEALRALRKASTPGRPAIRLNHPPPDPLADDGPEVSVEFGESVDLDSLGLDEPGGIGMEDSLELSLDNIPPAPFETLPPMKSRPHERNDPADIPLDLSLDGEGDALDLVAARATPLAPTPEDPLVDLRDRYAVGDFTGAHEIAEAILAEDPRNEEALRFRESCCDVLTQMYTARLGSTSRIPRLAIAPAELQWQSLDHRSGFLLSCIDGRSTIEEILDVSGMPTLDALRILYTLLQQEIIEVVDS